MNKSVQEIIEEWKDIIDSYDNWNFVVPVEDIKTLIKYFDDLDNARKELQS